MSWEGWLSILLEAKQMEQQQNDAPPTACPHDGEPLQSDSEGKLHCRFDGYTWPTS